jgi:hypothetical protein
MTDLEEVPESPVQDSQDPQQLELDFAPPAQVVSLQPAVATLKNG